MISQEDEAKILRLFHVEKWSKSAIAADLRVHHSVVSRVLERNGVPRERQAQSSLIEPYIPFIKEKIKLHPKIRASRLYRMVQDRGYSGGPDHFRHEIRKLRPRHSVQEAFLRLKTLPGDEAQVDWAHFGRMRIGRARRQLMAFLMVLSYSRRLFLHFFPGQTTVDFLRGHVGAFSAFGGVPRVLLYDNLKSAVLDRRGDAIRFNPALIALSAHYRFEPRPVAPYRGSEKGRVERAVRYVREAFFEALEWSTLEELNDKAESFCNGLASDRPWVEDRSRSVRDAFLDEQPALIPLPGTHFPVFDRIEVSVRKTPYARFDLNDYSVPHQCVGKTLVVVATPKTVRILDGVGVVAQHRRSYSRGEVIEDRRHIEPLVAMKRRARKGRGLDRLQRAAPDSHALLCAMAERGANIGSATFALLRLLDTFGPAELRFGIAEALAKGVAHPHAVRHAIERRREEMGAEPSLPIDLPDDPRVRDLTITLHDLSQYDKEDFDDDENQGRDQLTPEEAGP